MFLYFLRWLREHTDLRFEVVLLDGGPLVPEFEAVARVRDLGALRDGALSQRLDGIGSGRLGSRLRSLQARWMLRDLRRVRTVYGNSVTSLYALRVLGRPPDRVVVAHFHELEGGLRMAVPEADLAAFLAAPDEFVAASELVRRNLIDNYGVDPDHVTRHYEFIDVAALDTGDHAEAAARIRAELGIPDDAWVVGAVGATEWRKGPDLFVLLGTALRHLDAPRPIHLVWVGADPDASGTHWLHHDIEGAGLEATVHVVGPQAEPAPWFDLFDLLVLTSREDPFPLVCLEASLMGAPMVSFDNTGMVEFAGDGERGVIIPYLDVEAMAEAVVDLLSDEPRRTAMAERAGERVRAEHDIPVAAPKLWADLDRWRHRA
jgi:glycosyltransferase involved in cell wall biosynthesis